MRWIRWPLIIIFTLAIHVGLAMVWIFNQPKMTAAPEPMMIAMVAFESEEPAVEPAAAEPEPQVAPEPEPEPEPIIEPEPVVEPAIVLPQKKPEVKKKPKPKKEEKREIKKEAKPVEKQLAKNDLKSLSDMNSSAHSLNKNVTSAKTNTGATNQQSNHHRGPKALSKQLPSYPDRARRLGKDGYVKVRYDIDDDGRVTNIEFIETSPKGLFERDVKRAMNRWKYEKLPAKGYITEIYFRMDGSVSQA
ncbi:TonB family protein [Providencia sneebia]|uniref:Protein TonB n=1 Tax=Providencia sneebia DSM 19967 TaxID=1141660 RepID=K8WJ30_9GAMM|nr:TonB family protein [Providencia sneebia]EKT56230.1 transport protein TonB [Providencia sneebia DSM 19967]